MIRDELCARGRKAVIQNSRAYRTVTMVGTQYSGRLRSAFRNLCTGEGYDMHTRWYGATTIMRGESGDITIVKAITFVANPRDSHNIGNTQLGQPEGKGGSSMRLLAAKFVISLLANRLLWLSLYE
jgi:hypothetical protein